MMLLTQLPQFLNNTAFPISRKIVFAFKFRLLYIVVPRPRRISAFHILLFLSLSLSLLPSCLFEHPTSSLGPREDCIIWRKRRTCRHNCPSRLTYTRKLNSLRLEQRQPESFVTFVSCLTTPHKSNTDGYMCRKRQKLTVRIHMYP